MNCCLVLAITADGKQITTIEGLGTSSDLHASHRGAGLGQSSLSAAGRPGRPGRDPARAGGPGPAPGWDPGGGHDHHPQAGRLPRLPRLQAELELLDVNPLDRITWRPPRSPGSAGLRSAATLAEVQAILAEVTTIRPELTAFFGCLYYAALRPAEAVALRADSCILPSRGWGQLTLWRASAQQNRPFSRFADTPQSQKRHCPCPIGPPLDYRAFAPP